MTAEVHKAQERQCVQVIKAQLLEKFQPWSVAEISLETNMLPIITQPTNNPMTPLWPHFDLTEPQLCHRVTTCLDPSKSFHPLWSPVHQLYNEHLQPLVVGYKEMKIQNWKLTKAAEKNRLAADSLV